MKPIEHFTLRSTVLALLGIGAFFTGTASRSADDVSPADRPIPQDAAKIATLRAAKRKMCEEEFVRAYESIGSRSPKWDEPARKCTAALVELYCGAWPIAFENMLEMVNFADQAAQLGCDDALIFAVKSKYSISLNPGDPSLPNNLIIALNQLTMSNYSAYVRAMALGGILECDQKTKFASRAERNSLCKVAGKLLAKLLPSDHADHREMARDLFETLMNATESTGGNLQTVHEEIQNSLQELPDGHWGRDFVQGYYHYVRAWQIRGNSVGAAVGDDRHQKFQSELVKAKKAFEKSWQANSTDPWAACEMIDVCKGLGLPRADMETWFRRAMEINGDCRRACSLKMDYLRPAWRGSSEELLQFGRQCAATKNYKAGIPLELAKAHVLLFHLSDKRADYLMDDDVWGDLRQMYTGLFKLYPNAHQKRFEYADALLSRGEIQAAKEIVDSLPNGHHLIPLGGEATVDAFKKKIQDKIKSREGG